jgi:hypothetical protein
MDTKIQNFNCKFILPIRIYIEFQNFQSRNLTAQMIENHRLMLALQRQSIYSL